MHQLLANKRYIYIIIGIFVSLITLVGFFLMKQPEELPAWEQSTDIAYADTNIVEKMTVDLKGAVQQPGVYHIEENARLYELLEQAGGMTTQAAEHVVNLAEKLVDQQLVYIPSQDEIEEEAVVSTQATAKINLNTASVTELQTLSGIGAKKAQVIIDYREENGRFQTVDDLSNVSGIGEKTVEKLREAITV